MKIITKTVPMDFNIFLFGDSHEGSVLRHDDGWAKLIDMVKSEYFGINPINNFCVDHGDILEGIMVDDKRYSEFTTKEGSILQQMMQCVRQRDLIKGNIITILDGNHTYKLRKFGEITKDVCNRLEVEFGTYSCIIIYRSASGNILFKHYAHHGHGSIRSNAFPFQRRQTNKELALRNKFSEKFGDCLLNSMGHTHQLIVREPFNQPYMSIDGKNKLKMEYTKPTKKIGYIDPDHRWYVNAGSFYKAYEDGVSSYVEIAGYNPVELGFAIVRVRDGNIDGIDKIIVD